MSVIRKTITVQPPTPPPFTTERTFWACDAPGCTAEASLDTPGWVVAYVVPDLGSVTRAEYHADTLGHMADALQARAGASSATASSTSAA